MVAPSGTMICLVKENQGSFSGAVCKVESPKSKVEDEGDFLKGIFSLTADLLGPSKLM